MTEKKIGEEPDQEDPDQELSCQRGKKELFHPVIDGHLTDSLTSSFPADYAASGTTQKMKDGPPEFTNRPGDRETAEGL